jgi:hypothetical protein
MARNAIAQPGHIGAIGKIGMALLKRGPWLRLRIVVHKRQACTNRNHGQSCYDKLDTLHDNEICSHMN